MKTGLTRESPIFIEPQGILIPTDVATEINDILRPLAHSGQFEYSVKSPPSGTPWLKIALRRHKGKAIRATWPDPIGVAKDIAWQLENQENK